MTPRRRPRPRAPAAAAAAPARAAREARRWRCRERAVGAAARGRGGAGRTFPCVARMAAQGVGPGPGSAAPPGLEVARQKLALRRKKVLSTEEMELYELAQAAGGAIDPDVFKILVDLLKLNVAPLAVFQMLKSMCAGQRLASEPQDPAAVSLPTSSVPETRGRNKGSTALGGALALVERSSREGSSQRMPRQPSATRLPKGGGPGKSPTQGST
ncbi:mitotic-spindle organizing protein 2B-like isoform X1 [Nomascus leucogenys]|uniref:mitotic-spindle organizing protein 2B-like isoform X1 n=1 Tax=Nomascus leucogenys TaxID=61853 RepID=UPI00122D850A|nr:mitotic-spindle organizing protein 2B-like isoform X1 [Nomascus leucogenys]